MDLWGLDIVLTASQKAIGAPPGLSILIASQRAVDTYSNRKTPTQGYYASWKKWLPIMESYLVAKPAYFATQPVNLVCALAEALSELLKGGEGGLIARLEAHKKAARRLRAVAAQLGMKSLAVEGAEAAGLSAIWVPEGLSAAEVLQRASAEGVIFAGGLLPAIKDRYIRIGHMGVSVTDEERGDIHRVSEVLHSIISKLLKQKHVK